MSQLLGRHHSDLLLLSNLSSQLLHGKDIKIRPLVSLADCHASDISFVSKKEA